MVKLVHVIGLSSEDNNNNTSHTQNSNTPQISIHYLQYTQGPVRKRKCLYTKVDVIKPMHWRSCPLPKGLCWAPCHLAMPLQPCCGDAPSTQYTRGGLTREDTLVTKGERQVRIPSPFLIKFIKWGHEQGGRLPERLAPIKETKTSKNRLHNYKSLSTQTALKISMGFEDATLGNIWKD